MIRIQISTIAIITLLFPITRIVMLFMIILIV